MKITRKQLKQLIKEEIQKLDEVTTAMKIAAQRVGRPHPGSSPPPPSHPSRSGMHKSQQPNYEDTSKPLVVHGGRHENIHGYNYYGIAGVHVRNDYDPRTDYDGALDRELKKMGVII